MRYVEYVFIFGGLCATAEPMADKLIMSRVDNVVLSNATDMLAEPKRRSMV
ncbi:MAG: hypothetical protein ACREWG_08780 [Gammaproteobacteria bacterium]